MKDLIEQYNLLIVTSGEMYMTIRMTRTMKTDTQHMMTSAAAWLQHGSSGLLRF